MDYHCEYCDFEFFLEEGRSPVEGIICCPMCGLIVKEEVEDE